MHYYSTTVSTAKQCRGTEAVYLSSLLDAPELEKETGIQKALSNIGVQYTHRNEDLIAENVFEGQRLEALKEVRLQLRHRMPRAKGPF